MATRLKIQKPIGRGTQLSTDFYFTRTIFQSQRERAGKSVLTCEIHRKFIELYSGAAGRHVRETHELEP